MTSSISIYEAQQNLPNEEDFLDLFAELDELEPFTIKKEELAAQLAALLSCSNKTRSEFAAISGWKKSRVTNILNGCGNPTFKTLWEFARHLGYEADLNFRRPNECPAKQPWNRVKVEVHYLNTTDILPCYVIHKQTAQEIAKDMKKGNHKEYYFSLQDATVTLTHNKKTSLQSETLSYLEFLQTSPLTTKAIRIDTKEKI